VPWKGEEDCGPEKGTGTKTRANANDAKLEGCLKQFAGREKKTVKRGGPERSRQEKLKGDAKNKVPGRTKKDYSHGRITQELVHAYASGSSETQTPIGGNRMRQR